MFAIRRRLLLLHIDTILTVQKQILRLYYRTRIAVCLQWRRHHIGMAASMQVVSPESLTSDGQECAHCRRPITERFLLKAMDQCWHEDCLRCSCCDCRLGEVGSTLYTKADLLLCRRDYLRLFGATGCCSACRKGIPAFEMVMKAKGNVYHLDCFACQQCNHRFCIGDRYYLYDNKILCEFDYEENVVLSRMTQGGGGGGGGAYSNAALPPLPPHLRRPTTATTGGSAATKVPGTCNSKS